jgi:hypothetical protein
LIRRVRKILGNDRRVPVIKENKGLPPTVVKKGSSDDRIGRITISNDNVPIVQRRNLSITTTGEATKRPISKVDPILAGETVFIIGGGPSLMDFNWNALYGKKTIAINKSLLSFPQANILYWTDSRVYSWMKNEIDNFKGPKYTIRDHPSYVGDIKILRRGNKFGLEESKDTLSHGNNSGYAAINLAYHLGAKRIILLGYDMGNDGRRGHHHDGYPVPVTGDDIYRDQFVPGFRVLADLLKTKGIEVYNASPRSLLTVWPKITIEKALTFK